jgi:hypothetical protein
MGRGCWKHSRGIECSEDQPEKAQQYQYAYEDDPSLLKFAIDEGFGCSTSADLITTVRAELDIVPDFGAAGGAICILVVAAEAFQIFRAGAMVMHDASIPCTGRD